jgi:hypothetical protein
VYKCKQKIAAAHTPLCPAAKQKDVIFFIFYNVKEDESGQSPVIACLLYLLSSILGYLPRCSLLVAYSNSGVLFKERKLGGKRGKWMMAVMLYLL